MKKSMNAVFLYGLLLSLLFALSCGGEDDNGAKASGRIIFKMLNPGAEAAKPIALRSFKSNPSLTGDSTETILTGVKMGIGDIWVSQGIVKAGNPDDLEWIRLTDVTNMEVKPFEDYSLAPKEIPAGTYRSIKLTLRKILYWQTELASDRTVKYELLQTMGGTFDACDENDQSWEKADYFSEGGCHSLDDDGKFKVDSDGEKAGGFTVEEGKTAIVSWRWLMYGCTFHILDLNNNQVFDCGVDDIDMECPPEMGDEMFDFVVTYE